MNLTEKLNNTVAQFKTLDNKKKALLIGALIVIVVTLLLALTQSPQSPISPIKFFTGQAPTSIPYVLRQQKESFAYTLIYGVWSQKSSLIKQYDLQSGQETILAELPSNIKKVTYLTGGDLIYINKTNERDHGEEIAKYSFSIKQSSILFKSDPGFGIDDYVISPNKRYLATWEVKFASGSAILQGGVSRVLSVDLQNPTIKNLIYDEVSDENTPISYPRAITDSGDIYLDKFLPNSGAGWAYGMSFSNFTGTSKEDLPQIRNGTYATQPALSPGATVLAFAGYDGSNGQSQEFGFRKALVAANTIELYNLQSKHREKLANLSDKNVYSYVAWDLSGENLIFTQLAKDPESTGFYVYDLNTKVSKKLQLAKSQVPLSTLQKDKVLIATQDSSNSTLGNLGQNYAHSITSFLILNINDRTTVPVNLGDTLVQYISLVPSQNRVLGASTLRKTIQIIAIPLTILAPVRNCQQSIPPPGCPTPTPTPTTPAQTGQPTPTSVPPPTYTPSCVESTNCNTCSCATRTQSCTIISRSRSCVPYTETRSCIPTGCSTPTPTIPVCNQIAIPQCLFGNTSALAACQFYITSSAAQIPSLSNCGLAIGNQAAVSSFNSCVATATAAGQQSGTCYDSPLYLYGPSGLKIKIIAESDGQIFNVTLPEEPIYYNYIPGIKKIMPPSEGMIASKETLPETLRYFSKSLGLNEKESNDLVEYGKSHIISPFVFVSFFDEETSKKILPLKFDPEPDTYINIIFYFKPLPKLPSDSPNPPTFSNPPLRKGFTAVEISEFLDQ